MKQLFTLRILVAAFLVLSWTRLYADEEQDLITTLQSGAGAPQKWAACQRLKVIGTPKAVPALAALLADPQLSQAARHALESIPSPETDAALRDALGKTSGLLKAGVIDSLGWQRKQESVPLLKPLLSDSDQDVAQASAAALGRIGGGEAVAALSASRDKAQGVLQTTVLESLLKCAERSATGKDTAAAVSVYHNLFNTKYPVQVRTAAWRGLALSDTKHRADLIVKALRGPDRPLQIVAAKLLRELADNQVARTCVAHWDSFPSSSQLAVLDAQVKLGTDALPLVQRASQSADLQLRIAAWQAMGQLNDTASIHALAKAAAQGELPEREAARDSLERLRGPGAGEALLRQLESAPTPEKTELLSVLGERGDRAVSGILLKNAASDVKPVRLAALEALSRLAPPDAATTLLDMAAKSKSDDERGPILKALYAVCDDSPNKDQTGRELVEKLGHFSTQEKRPLLPLLSELGTADALAAAQTASHDPQVDLAKEAVSVLSEWPNASPTGWLLEMAKTGTDSTLQALALRGALQVAGQEPDLAKRLGLVEQAMAGANRVDEKKQALGQIGQIPTPEALEVALQGVSDPDLSKEASLAALTIAEKLAPAHPDLADQAAGKVLSQVHEGGVARRAWALRRKPGTTGEPFIKDWQVCGPYRQNGAIGATAVFDIPFGPEKSDSKTEWKAVPPADHVNLGALFPGQENCAAYLRTCISVPDDCTGLLLIGSDDGVKVWLNGKVVHSNNVDRGEVIDQDTAPISLKKGSNDLLIKITQGGGGWSACARIVGSDFKSIPGLQTGCK